MRTPERAREWRECTIQASDDFLHPIKDNDTRWFSIYMMLVRAVYLRDTITLFTANNMVADKDGKNLSESIMSKDDWNYCSDVITFMKPLFLLVKDLEGKPESGANGFITDVLPAYDFIKDHINDQLQAFEQETFINEKGEIVRSIGHTNTLNALAKLQKYKQKNTSLVLFTAYVLVPWRK